ncbi:unknown [Anaerostipes sp. CAG:276]|nr:unknown [Anaerostipes sp. CAG:276]
MVFQSLNSIRSRFFWRIQECQISNQHHVTLIFDTKCANWGRIAFLCNPQNAKSLVVKIIHCLQNPTTNVIRQRLHSSITLCKCTNRKHFFHSTFCYHLGLALFILHHSSQTATSKVKRNLVYLYIVFGQVNETRICCFFFLRLIDNRQIHQVFIAGLEVTINVSVTQYSRIVLAIYIQVVFQHNLILGQSAGLVGAENVNGTEILNRIEVFNDCLLLAHGNSTFRKTGCYNHRQHFRCQTDSNRNAE